MNNKERILWIDYVKVFACILVVLGHLIQSLQKSNIDNFENIYQSARGMNLRALVISGRDGVGKDMFISKCLDKIGGYDAESTPFYINLGNKEGIENFIIQLNLITRTYDEIQLMTILGASTSEKTNTAANLVNELLNTNSVLSIKGSVSFLIFNLLFVMVLTVTLS